MTTLDNPNNRVDESSVPFFPTALRYGGIAGLILVAYQMLSHLTGLSTPSSMMSGILSGVVVLVAVVLIAVFTIRHHREKELGGYVSFGRAFLVSLVALVIAGIISTLFNILYMTVIDPGFADTAAENMRGMFEGFNMPEDQIDASIEAAKANFTVGGLVKQGLLWGNVMNAVIALIVAAIMKKNPSAV